MDVTTLATDIMSLLDDDTDKTNDSYGLTSNRTDALLGNAKVIQFPKDMLGFTAACAFIIAFFGTLGNLLTIFALPMYRKLRTTATAYVINLALVELLFCVCILPMSGAQYAYLQYFDTALLSHTDCIFFATARYTFTQVELQTIVAIALTRAIAVGFPRFYQKIDTKSFTGAYISLIWLYCFLLKLPTALGKFGSYVFNSKTMECDMAIDLASIKARKIMLLVEVLIPVVTILVLYIFIFIMLIRRCINKSRKFRKGSTISSASQSSYVKMSSRRVARSGSQKSKKSVSLDDTSSSTDNSARKPSTSSLQNFKRMLSDTNLKARLSRRSSSTCVTNRRDMRVARTIFIIFMMVIICSIPVGLIHAIDSEGRQPRRFLAVHILYWMQYCLNMVVYVLMNRQYREAYVELLAKILPSWERYKDFSFPWENPSISSKPAQGPSSSFKGRKDSYSQDTTAPPKEYKPARETLGSHRPAGVGRLSAIIEVNSSSCVSNDDVFISEAPIPEQDEEEPLAVKSKEEEESGSAPFKHHEDEGTAEERQHWITQNGHMTHSISGIEENCV